MRLNQKQMALRLAISTRTLRRYVSSGKLVPEGYEKNRPYYSEKQVIQYALKFGKIKKVKIVWKVKQPLNKEKNKSVNTINKLVLTNRIEDFFDLNNPKLNLILDLLVEYKLKELIIDAAVFEKYPKEINLLDLICKKFDVTVKKETFNNEN